MRAEMAQEKYYDENEVVNLLRDLGGEHASDRGLVRPELAELLNWPGDAMGRALERLDATRRITRDVRGKRTFRVALRDPDEPDDPLTLMRLVSKDVVRIRSLRAEADELEWDVRQRLKGRMSKTEIEDLFEGA